MSSLRCPRCGRPAEVLNGRILCPTPCDNAAGSVHRIEGPPAEELAPMRGILYGMLLSSIIWIGIVLLAVLLIP